MANIILDYDGTIHDCAKIYVPSFYIGYKYLTETDLHRYMNTAMRKSAAIWDIL